MENSQKKTIILIDEYPRGSNPDKVNKIYSRIVKEVFGSNLPDNNPPLFENYNGKDNYSINGYTKNNSSCTIEKYSRQIGTQNESSGDNPLYLRITILNDPEDQIKKSIEKIVISQRENPTF